MKFNFVSYLAKNYMEFVDQKQSEREKGELKLSKNLKRIKNDK